MFPLGHSWAVSSILVCLVTPYMDREGESKNVSRKWNSFVAEKPPLPVTPRRRLVSMAWPASFVKSSGSGVPVNQDQYQEKHVGVSKNRGTPQIIHSNRVFPYKPSILGETPLF